MRFSLKELAKKIDISADTLIEWVGLGLVNSDGGTGTYFNEDAFNEAEAVKKFVSMGYELEAIRKIKCDVGLPVKEHIKEPGFAGEMLTVGEIADAGGVNTRTIKFWEEKGLIQPFQRSEGGFRLYQVRDVDRVKFIKDLQTCNYTLAEIGNILKLMGKDLHSLEPEMDASPQDLEKTQSGLEYLIERMKETRHATSRVEALFARRLKDIVRLQRNDKDR